MRQTLIAALLIAAPLALSGCETSGGTMVTRSHVMETARRVSERYASTWNANDMAGFGALYTEDARHVNLGGGFLRGRAAIVDTHRANRGLYPSGVRMVTRLEGARAISNDTIVSVMIVEFAGDDGAASGIQSARLTCTLVRQSGGWLIAQAHASPSR